MLFGRVAAALGDDAALRDLAPAPPYDDLWMVDGISACIWGPVQLELARIVVALGEAEEARTLVSAARRVVERADAPPRLTDIEALEDLVGERPFGPSPPSRPRTCSTARARSSRSSTTARSSTPRTRRASATSSGSLSDPGREVHVLDLVGGPGPASGDDLGEVIDPPRPCRVPASARAARHRDRRRRRPRRPRITRTAAGRTGLPDRGARRALGLGGRPRRAGEVHERARKAVSARIRLAIERLGADHPSLERHLAISVQTGTFCCYRPERPTIWTV